MAEGETVSTPPDIDAFLQEHRRTFFITLRSDGTPTVHPMTGLYNQGSLHYTSYRRSAKNRNIERDARVCCLALNGYDAEQVRAVTLKGVARIREGAEMPQRRPVQGVEPSSASRARRAIRAGRRVIIEIVPAGVIGFMDQVRGE